jgi:hypothetical protein
MNFETQGDALDSLPSDKVEPNSSEMHILNRLFNDDDFSDGSENTFKDIMLAGMVFFLVSLPVVHKGIVSFFPSCSNDYVGLLVRTAIFILLYFVARQALLT